MKDRKWNLRTPFPIRSSKSLKPSRKFLKRVYPIWVTVASFAVIFLSIIILTAGLSLSFELLGYQLFGRDINLIAYIPAFIISYIVTMRFVCLKANAYFLKFARFETDFSFVSHFTINASGLTIDEGDKHTHIDWSGIGGVFETKNYMCFYCRGLVYTVPLERIATGQKVDLLERCKAWQSAAETHETARAFL